nr:MAG TPA: Integrase [Caudoviricetes sp.]
MANASKDYNYVRKTFTHNGTRYEVKGKTEAEAIERMALKREELRRGEATSGGNMPVNKWFTQWLELYKTPAGLTPKSLGMYRQLYDRHIGPAVGRMKLQDVRDIHLQKILNGQAGMSYSHCTKLRSAMQQLFGRAYRSRLIPFDPSAGLTLPATQRNSRRSLTDEEREVFLAVEPTVPGGILWYAALYTGMRPGELAALQWRDVDFAAGEIHVCRALESGSWGTIKEPKTAAGVRTIPLRRPLADRLRPLRGEPMETVFRNQAGRPHNTTTMQRLWGSIIRAMDIAMGAEVYRNQIITSVVADDLVPYCLRHTFCTDLQRAGVPINVAKELMGHADIATTANIYTHGDTETLHAYVAQMDAPDGREKLKAVSARGKKRG